VFSNGDDFCDLDAVERHAFRDCGGVTHQLQALDSKVAEYLGSQTKGPALSSRYFWCKVFSQLISGFCK